MTKTKNPVTRNNKKVASVIVNVMRCHSDSGIRAQILLRGIKDFISSLNLS